MQDEQFTPQLGLDPSSIKKESKNFFFYHNGITAICSDYIKNDDKLEVREMSVVNGCQSLNTIYNCSEAVREHNNGYVLFRFIKSDNPEMISAISTATNSQIQVKARDLKSNEKVLKLLSRKYKALYPDGCILLKRGEDAPKTAKKENVVNVVDLAKEIATWNLCRPTITDNENKLFDHYFETLFRDDYDVRNIYALNKFFNAIKKYWVKENPLDLDTNLLGAKSYGVYYHLYALQQMFCIANNNTGVPKPAIIFDKLNTDDCFKRMIEMAGNVVKNAFEAKKCRYTTFIPKKWMQNKEASDDVKNAVRSIMAVISYMDDEPDFKLNETDFEEVWTLE